MKTIFNIARKEFIDTLRDKRTLLVMIVVPLLLFPVIFSFVSNIQQNSMEEARERQLNIGYSADQQGNEFLIYLTKQENVKLIPLQKIEGKTSLIKQDSLDAILNFSEGFYNQIDNMQTGTVEFYYESTEEGVEDRIASVFKTYEDNLVSQRLNKIDVDATVINPVDFNHHDVATTQEKIGKYAGGLIPYVFILFCFIGAMYPAIDLFTGEKERSTIETILTSPVKRIQILSGKMIVVVATGIFSALLAIVGLFVGLNFADTLPTEIIDVTGDILQVKFIVLLLTMLIPLTIFFAGVLVPISIYAKSFKEAQSIITPINILVIVPAIVGMLPGVELSIQTAAIPIVNIALATKEIIAGTIDYGLLTVVYGSLIVIAVASALFSARYFSQENNILRV
jgi:sodium transport system permease protein